MFEKNQYLKTENGDKTPPKNALILEISCDFIEGLKLLQVLKIIEFE